MVFQTKHKQKDVSEKENSRFDDKQAEEQLDQAVAPIQTKRAILRAEESKQIITKKRRAMASFAILPDEIWSYILPYLDNVREIYRLSTMNKSIRNAITPELVIRTAVFHGSAANKTVNRLIQEIEKKRIRVPSTLRMLRLLNARSCERGNQCFGYHLQDKRSGDLVGASVLPFGMAICTPCLEELSSDQDHLLSEFENDHICVHGNEQRMLLNPQFEKATGKDIGPLIFPDHLQQISWGAATESEGNSMLEISIHAIGKEAIGPEDEKRAGRFIFAHREGKLQYEEKCKAAAPRVFQQIQSQFLGFKYESLALSCDWCSDTGICTFRYWPSRATLGQLLSEPISANPKKIREAVAAAKEAYNQLERLGFLGDANYPRQLTQWLNAEGNNWPQSCKSLVRYFVEHMTSDGLITESFLSGPFYNVDEENPDEKVYNACRSGNPAAIIFDYLQGIEIRESFVQEAVRGIPNSTNSSQKRMKLSRYTWRCHYYLFLQDQSFAAYCELFHKVEGMYREVLGRIRQYECHPETKAWVTNVLESGNFSQFLKPQDAIDTLYEGKFGDVGPDACISLWRQHHAEMVHRAFELEKASITIDL